MCAIALFLIVGGKVSHLDAKQSNSASLASQLVLKIPSSRPDARITSWSPCSHMVSFYVGIVRPNSGPGFNLEQDTYTYMKSHEELPPPDDTESTKGLC